MSELFTDSERGFWTTYVKAHKGEDGTQRANTIIAGSDYADRKKETNMNDQEILEEIIDRKGLTFVVDLVCQICYDKAEHIEVSYSDKPLAEHWRKSGLSLVNPKPEFEFEFPS